MTEPTPAAPPAGTVSVGAFARLSGYAANALRYWEPSRIIYNIALGAVVLIHFGIRWPGSRAHVSAELFLGLFFLAVMANVLYCTAYIVDIFVQISGLENAWRIGRIGLFVIGTAFAATITHFFAQGMFNG